jgi:hypothetical protein
MVFLLTMEPLHRLFKKAQGMSFLSNPSRSCDTFRISFYVDDAALFLKPLETDLKITIGILKVFAQASSLTTNMSKTECYPIQCANTDLSFLNEANLLVSHFPCKYLGLPLHYRKPSRTMLQPVI